MTLVTEPYSEQVKVWPKEGRHILAQYDDDTIIVYQAYPVPPLVGMLPSTACSAAISAIRG